MKHTFALIALLVVSLLAGCATSSNRTSAWEYKLVEGKVFGPQNRLDAAINKQVTDGWEVFSPIRYGAEDWGFTMLRRPTK